MIKKNEIDITPKTKIYSIFQNMNYKLETAISEFVDNSIASFRENKEYFDNNEIEKTIILFFDNTMNKIIIFDNAYGISNNDFPRVLRLAELPKDTSGLNEYGMGLKASSFWLGNSLKVVSKYRDNSYSNELKVTLDELEKGKNKIEVSKNESYLKIPYLKNGHGTFIEINGVRRNMTTSVLTPLVKILSSKYRNDIYDNTNIKIIAKESTNKIIDICKTNFEKKKSFLNNDELYKATSLFYKEVEFYKNEKNEIYRKEKFFEIKHLIDGKIKKLKFSGVFGIKKHGTRKEYYAFDLFRRKRIVKSGYDPSHLFGIGNSFETLRITGWFHMDEFPTNQQKDDFAWEGELEEKFLNTIFKDLDFQYIKKLAHTIRAKSELKILNIRKIEMDKTKSFIKNHFQKNIILHEKEEIQKISIENGMKYDNTHLLHTIKNIYEQDVKIYSKLSEDNSPEEWIKIDKLEDKETLLVTIDMNSPFFNPFNENGNFRQILRLFVICFALSVENSVKTGKDANEFKEHLGKLLSHNKEGFNV